MSTRAFRFGVVAAAASDLKSLTELARQAEDLGYDTLLAPDPLAGHLDPLTALSAAAAVTTTLRVGTFVLADAYRDRRMLDWQAQTLHALTGGRFELGLGTGRPGTAERAAELGREHGTPAQRVERLAETIAYLKRREDRPRLLVAGAGPKVVELAAREADILSLALPPMTNTGQAKSIVDGVGDIELGLNLLAYGHEPDPWVKQIVGVDVPELAAADALTVLPGSVSEAADALRQRREVLGVSYVKVNSVLLEKFAPVVAALRGR